MSALVHGTTVIGFLTAVDRCWGADGRRVLRAHLGVSARERLLEQIVLAHDWLPEEHAVEVVTVVWRELAAEDQDRFRGYVATNVEAGWGRVQKALVRLLTPRLLSMRASELWRAEHSAGVLRAQLAGHRGTVTLREHPYVEHFATRLMLAESFSHIVGLTGARQVRCRQHTELGQLRLELSWGDEQSRGVAARRHADEPERR